MSDFLAQMAASSAARAAGVDAARVRRAAEGTPEPPLVRPEGFVVIAEMKLRSPALGTLGRPDDPLAEARRRARGYADGGATALSVLTEPSRFDGDLTHLAAASAVGAAPTMRKDFLVDPVQVWEARAAGASGVLLIAAMLDDAALGAVLDAARDAGLFVLLEAFDADDLRRCRAALDGWRGRQPLWVGVNCRDLRTLKVDPERFASLAGALPEGTLRIAESGVEGPEDAARVARLGYDGVLVGGALMKANDPTSLVRALRDAGGGARSR